MDLLINDTKILEMTEEQLKKELLKINKEQLSSIGYLAFFQILNDFIHLKEQLNSNINIINKIGKEGKEIGYLVTKIESNIKNIDVLFDLDYGNGSLEVDYFRRLRDEAILLIDGVSSYLTEISYAGEIVNDIIMREQFKRNNFNKVRKIDFNNFYEDVYKFLTEDMNLLFDKISKIICVLPVRISKQIYYDIIRKAVFRDLKNINQAKIDLIIKRYKSIFNGTLDSTYGQKFDLYFRLAQECRNYDFKNKSIEELEVFHTKIVSKLNELYIILNIIRECGLIINRLIVISSVKEYMSKNLKDFNIKSLVNGWINAYDQSDNTIKNKFINICNDNIKSVEEKIRCNNINLDKIINIYDSKNYSTDEEINNVLLKTQNLTAYLNDIYVEREELILFNKERRVDNDYLVQVIDNFIQFIDRNIKDMPNIQRKVRLRRILSVIPTPFLEPQEFFRYLKNSLELNQSQEDMIYDLNKITVIMQEYTGMQNKH